MNTAPDFSKLTSMFSNLAANPMLSARGGAFVDPAQAQQQATGGYLGGRGDVATSYLQNLFSLANLANTVGSNQGQIATLIPQLQAANLRAQSGGGGSFSSIAGAL
jgi:hypothetical protein